MKKTLLLGLLLALICIFGSTVYAEETLEREKEQLIEKVQNGEIGLGDLTMDSYKVYEEGVFTDEVIDYMNRYKELVPSSGYNPFYVGTEDECHSIYYDFLLKFGYTTEIDVELLIVRYQNKTQWAVSFVPNENPDAAIASYINEFLLTKKAAEKVKRNTAFETVEAVREYEYENFSYYYGDEDDEKHIYFAFSGNEILCDGYSQIGTHLLNMNGVRSENAIGYYDNVLHRWNIVYTENGPLWYDFTGNKSYPYDSLPEKYNFLSTTENTIRMIKAHPI